MDRSETFSNAPTPMSRKRSSSSRYGPAAFPNATGGIPICSYQEGNEEPFSSYSANTSRPSKFQCTGPGRPTSVAKVYEPSEFLDSIAVGKSSLSPTAPVSTHRRPRVNSQHKPSSPRQAPMFNSNSNHLFQFPPSPSSGELTIATTLPSAAMSRQASTSGSSYCGGFEHLKLNSPGSDDYLSDGHSNFDFVPSPNDEFFLHMSEADRSHLVDHTGGMVKDGEPQSAALPLTFPMLPQLVEDVCLMKRSSSMETNASQSRLSRRSQEQTILSSRLLAPKVSNIDSQSKEPTSSDQRHIITSEDGSSKEVVSIPKAPYVRPQSHKVMCPSCNEQPQGFRGEHELRRHTDRKHTDVRKAWICVDISVNKKFLANCKKCVNGKRYNVYYNAAAHLRRAHFNPKQKGGKGRKEKRGGKGGGDQPSMDTLKMWMTEIEEDVRDNVPSRNEEEDDDEDNVCADLESEKSGFDISHTNKVVDTTSVSSSSSSIYDKPLQLTASASDSAGVFDSSLESSLNANSHLFLPFDNVGSSDFHNPEFQYGLDDSLYFF